MTAKVQLVRPDLAQLSRKMQRDLAEQHEADVEAERRAAIDGIEAPDHDTMYVIVTRRMPGPQQFRAEVVSGKPPEVADEAIEASAEDERKALRRLHWQFVLAMLRRKVHGGDMEQCRARAAAAQFQVVDRVG